MTLEEKAKAYDEALKQIKECTPDENGFVTIYPNEIFPTLRESEDERIRKGMLQGFKDYNEPEYEWWKGVKVKECITWLEKQGEPTEINPSEFDLRLNRLLKQFETLPKEELESSLSFYLNVIQNNGTYKNKKPKFEAGSWITNGEFVWLISNVGDFDYEVISPKGECVTDTISHVDEYFHLWSIEDAKDGDILTANIHHWEIGGNIENLPVRVPTIFIYRETKTDDKNVHACVSLFDNTTLNIYKSMYYIDDFGIKNIHPATKEQQNLLFLTMKNAGYEWDAEKKEPKKIHVIDEGKDEIDSCFTKMMNGEKVSFAWSEEDEKMFINALDMIEWYGGKYEEKARNVSDWLKSLKDRVQPERVWSEEDEEQLNCIIKEIESELKKPYFEGYDLICNKKISWLRLLKQRLKNGC